MDPEKEVAVVTTNRDSNKQQSQTGLTGISTLGTANRRGTSLNDSQ